MYFSLPIDGLRALRAAVFGGFESVKVFRDAMDDYNNGDFQASALLKDVCV